MYEKKNGVNLNTRWSIMLIILLFFPLIFFENSFDKRAGALRFVEMWFPQLFELKFSSLSFSNKDALFIRQLKNFNFNLYQSCIGNIKSSWVELVEIIFYQI